MIAFTELLIQPASEAGMKTPDSEEYDPDEFPHFHLFCCAQLGQSMPSPTSHWHNAKVIASIPEDELRTVTAEQLKERGFEVGFPVP